MLSFDKKTMIRRYSSNTVFFLYFFGHTFPTLHNCKDGRFKRWHPRFCSTCCHWDIHYTQVRHVAGGPLQKEAEPSSPHQTRHYNNTNNNNHDQHVKFNHSARLSAADESEEFGRMKKSSRYDACYTSSNPRNNHDQQKFKHSTRASAEAEIRRMKESGCYDECERLNTYYNDEYEGWFVGRG